MKKILSVILVLAMVLTFAGCQEKPDYEAQVAQLEQENAALIQQVNELQAQLDRMMDQTVLKEWKLDALVWTEQNGATINFTAVPVEYVEGQTAILSIRIDDMEAESAVCTWNGSAYTTSVDLTAADGYSYYCVMSTADGTQERVALNTPEAPTDDMLVNLATSLSSYANMFISEWNNENNKLTLVSGTAQVQTPRLTADGKGLTLKEAALVLQLNAEEVERQALTLPEGEGEGSYEQAVENISFDMPKMDADARLDILIEVTLSNGETFSSNGGSFVLQDGKLEMLAG